MIPLRLSRALLLSAVALAASASLAPRTSDARVGRPAGDARVARPGDAGVARPVGNAGVARPAGDARVARPAGDARVDSPPSGAPQPLRPSSTIVVTLGDPEVVMDYSADSCPDSAGLDLPDIQARAMRRPDGSLLLLSGNAPRNYVMTGPDFEHLTRDCTPVLVAGDDHSAASFDNQEWLLAVYREGTTVHGLVHNEYHDPVAANCSPGNTQPGNPCWYNAITYAESTDEGRHFSQITAPDHVVAAVPYPWDPTAPRGAPPPQGYFTPSNIVPGPDGYFYSMFMSISDTQTRAQGQCVMRTRTLGDPASWRAWDGTGFNLTMRSPYDADGNPAPTGLPACTAVSQRVIAGLGGSLTFNTYLDQYILVGSGVFTDGGAQTCGSWFTLSDDLITWTTPQLLMAGKLPYGDCAGGTPNGSLIYPSLIDHAAPGDNFEQTGQTPYLYYVRWNNGLDRDLLRVPVRFDLLQATSTPGAEGTPTATGGAPTPTATGGAPTPTATGGPTRPVRMTATPTSTPGAGPTRPVRMTATPTSPSRPTRPAEPTPTTRGVYLPVAVQSAGRDAWPRPEPGTPAPTATATEATATPTATTGAGAGAPFEPADGLVYHGTSPNPADVDAYIAALDPAIAPLVEGTHLSIPGTRPANFSSVLQRFVTRVTDAGRVPHLSFAFVIGDGEPVDVAIADSDTYDAMIDEAARITASVNGPVFVRPGFEFNGSWNGYTAGAYPRAFRKFVDRFRAAGAANAIFIWCYEPDAPGDFAEEAGGEALWYPGDDYVDWFGLDVFQSAHFDPDVPLEDGRGLTPRGRAEAFLAMARDHGKPVYLSEVAAVKIQITEDEADGRADWDAWFAKWFAWLAAHPEIKGFNIMSQDYRGTRYDTDYGWGNARLQDNAYILARWKAELAGPRFLHHP